MYLINTCMSPIHLCHQYVYVTNMCMSPICVHHQYTYLSNMCMSSICVCHQYMYVINTCMSPIHVCHQYVYVTNMCTSPTHVCHQQSHSNDHSVTQVNDTTWVGVIQGALGSVHNTWSATGSNPGSTHSAHLSQIYLCNVLPVYL